MTTFQVGWSEQEVYFEYLLEEEDGLDLCKAL